MKKKYLSNIKPWRTSLLCILLSGLVLFSCSDFLEEEPYDFVSPENLQTSPTGVKQMVTGMYAVFYDAQMFRNESWIYLTVCDDEWTDGVEWAMSTYGVGNFAGGWMYNNPGNDPYYVFYRLIRAANAVLEVLPNVNFNAEDKGYKEQFEGEALTIRALGYFYLVQMYGALPLHLHTDDPSTMARNPISEVYDQILNDLHKAEKLLFNKSESPLPRGHITKGAAQLLLAKVYNTMGSGSLAGVDVTAPITISRLPNRQIVKNSLTFTKNQVEGYSFDPMVCYDSAKNVAMRLIMSRQYQMETYTDTWYPANYGGNDFVFALETDSIGGYATVFNKFMTPVGLYGSGWLHYAKDLYYLYDSLDTRSLYGIAHGYRSNIAGNNGTWKILCFPAEDSMAFRKNIGADTVLIDNDINYCFLMKWYVGNSAKPIVQIKDAQVITGQTQNFPLMRFTEALLILAEAENELNGPTSLAYDALDEVRRWRYVGTNESNYYLMDRSAYNQQQLRSYILDERNREFIGEGYRRFDLIRWGIYLQVMNAVDHRAPYANTQDQIISKRREQKHLLYPIPTIEIDGNTAFGENNPGW